MRLHWSHNRSIIMILKRFNEEIKFEIDRDKKRVSWEKCGQFCTRTFANLETMEEALQIHVAKQIQDGWELI
jgi:hypothetical protein